jgi:AcrR family transcriptional regulator
VEQTIAKQHFLTMVNFSLDADQNKAQDLTMVKNDPATDKGEQTRRHIFETALVLFRERGFDATTMQQIAERAAVVKSAAYYYFPSKEAIIQAYYEEIQSAQEKICEQVFARKRDLKARIAAALHSKFDLARDDRNLLGVVFRYTGEPRHPLSCLGEGTGEIRRRAIAVFEQAIETERMPRDLRQLLPIALWALQMGLLVMFLYDETEGQRRTRRVADDALDLTLKLLALAKFTILKPVRTKVLALLRDAELVPEN